MGRLSDEYRRLAHQCEQHAQCTQDAEYRLTLEQTAARWYRRAEELEQDLQGATLVPQQSHLV
jgi:hypothetical protein